MNPNEPQNPVLHSDQADQLKSELKEAAADTAQSIKSGMSRAGESLRKSANTVREKASEQFSDLKDGAEEAYDQAKARMRTLGEDGKAFIRENPIGTVLAAFALGIVVGVTMRH